MTSAHLKLAAENAGATAPWLLDAFGVIEPTVVPRFRHLVEAFALAYGIDAPTRRTIGLCVSEAVTLCVLHEGRDPAAGRVRVTADITEAALEVVVRDDGGSAQHPRTPSARGPGLLLIARSASRFSLDHRAGSGVEVWMRFLLDEPAHPPLAVPALRARPLLTVP